MASEVEWGVMFTDGSVEHSWNGRTQRQRAEEHLALMNDLFPHDNITLAYRIVPDGAWHRC